MSSDSDAGKKGVLQKAKEILLAGMRAGRTRVHPVYNRPMLVVFGCISSIISMITNAAIKCVIVYFEFVDF